MKKALILVSLLFLSACQPALPTQEVVEPTPPEPSWLAPEVFLNHPDTPVQALAQGIEDIGVCYQIFVISFADSNNDGAGDLNGITESLDYFTDLNVQCLWLTPIHPSPSYHKYDVLDYYSIDPMFGTLADFDRLIAEAKARGIVILMDLVVNHSSRFHPWFEERPEFYRIIERGHPDFNTASPYWRRHGDLLYYSYFDVNMAELNLDYPDVREETFKIAEFWLNRGVGGFRLDAVPHFFDPDEYPLRTNTLSQNITYLKAFNAHVKAINPEAIVLAEVWQSAISVSRYLVGVDGAFNFDLSKAILDSIIFGQDTLGINYENIQNFYTVGNAPYVDLVFLTNHDQDRIMSVLRGDQDRAKLAASILFTLPGISFIYYGEELGMFGARTAAQTDAERRQGMPWQTDKQVLFVDGYVTEPNNQLLAPGNAMHDYYRLVSSLKQDPIIRLGQWAPIEKQSRDVIAYTLTYEGKTYAIIHNLTPLPFLFTLSTAATEVLSLQEDLIENDNGWRLGPYASVIFQVDTNEVQLIQ
jgi:glycosidase